MMKLKGKNRLAKKLSLLSKSDLPKVYAKTMGDSLVRLQRTAMENTPHDTGNLKSSFRTAMTEASAKGISGKIWNIAEYALVVHEATWMTLHHGGRHKYLEYALNIEKAFFKRILAYNINTALRSR